MLALQIILHIDVLGVFLADLHDLFKGSFPNHFEQVECINCQGLMLSGLVCKGKVE